MKNLYMKLVAGVPPETVIAEAPPDASWFLTESEPAPEHNPATHTRVPGAPYFGSGVIKLPWVILPKPPAPVPAVVTNSQCRDALTLAGIMPGDVMAVINLIPDPVQKQLATNKWEYANVIERNHPMIALMAPLLGFSEAQIDDLFRQAANL